jgi:fatty acid desaturase
MGVRPLSHYAREIRSQLPDHAFETVPTRLVWLAFHVSLIVAGTWAIATHFGPAIVWSLAIGHSFAGCAFVGHETMHGAVVRNPRLRLFVGWICFLPFTLSPRLWVAWHNRTHHGHTGEIGVDPDAYPTIEQFQQSKLTRFADHLSFARDRPLGHFMTLALGFTGQSVQMMWRWGRQTIPRREYRWMVVETLLSIAVWTALGVALGGRFVFAFVIPLAIGNAVVMAYILTNHSLSPLTATNDPLFNTLTVTVPRLVAWVHLDFGLHVEHHLFPAMSSKHAPLVRDQLVKRWPALYQSLPLFTALRMLWSTPRVYASDTVLKDPRTGFEAKTLGGDAGADHGGPDLGLDLVA